MNIFDRSASIESRAMRDSARGQSCTLEILGACNNDPATTVLAHLPDETNGMGKKSDDLSACYACAACHDVIDGRAKWPVGEYQHRDWYMRRAQTDTLRRMVVAGIITIKGVQV